MRPASTSIGLARKLAWVGVLGLVLTACAGPVGTNQADPKAVLRDLARSATTTGEPTWQTRNVLLEQGLLVEFEENPEEVLAALHKTMATTGGDPDLLFALAELSFLHGQATGSSSYQLAGAIYAYAFLFPEDGGAAPGRFDPRLRIAADLYNWALMAPFASEDGSTVVPRSEVFGLPFGKIDVAFDPGSLRLGHRELYNFVRIAELEVYGLAMRYRWPGLGAPLAASTRPLDPANTGGDMIAPRLRVPLTALLRISDARRALVRGELLAGRLELHVSWDAESVTIAGEEVPLENEPSAAMALTFTGVPVLELEMFGFLGRISGAFRDRPPLVSTTPYRPGLIPVVFVHGTASSVVRWAEMYNRLLADPEIRKRYQFWFFQYDSGNPIVLSALRLREALTGAIARLDPQGKDPAMRRMVLIGHSQGGLLVKMQVINSGDRLWSAANPTPLERLVLSDQTRALLKNALFVEPLPNVSRVVFVCTPHRGSFVAGRNFIANITRRLLSVPLVVTEAAADLARNRPAETSVIPSAVDNMSPRNRFIRALQDIPVASSVTVNSIVAVEGDGPVEAGDDGVVKYSSAHIEPVESELVVRSNHSTQGNPHTIEEVRRILRLHAGVKPGGPLLETR